eukprot:12306438-Heterocapsa_arctica.AAC.1
MKFIRCVSRSLRRMKWMLVLLDLAADQRGNDMVTANASGDLGDWQSRHLKINVFEVTTSLA